MQLLKLSLNTQLSWWELISLYRQFRPQLALRLELVKDNEEKMNTAYASSNLFHKICQNADDDKSIVDDRSSLQVANAFLHLHPPNDNDAPTIGTPLRLISGDGIDSDIEEVIHLHPLMIRVLSRLSPHRFQEDNTYNVLESNRHTVLLSNWDSDGLSTTNIDGNTIGWLEHISIINDDKIKELDYNHTQDVVYGIGTTYPLDASIATVHISYICSSNSKGRALFKEVCESGDICEFLYGGALVEGGIIGMDHFMAGENYDEEVTIFFMVNKIIMKDGSGNSRFLYFGGGRYIDIELDEASDTPPTRPIQQPKIQEDVFCPGYQSVLNELLTLAKMNNPNGAPTAVILSGCAGVGKTRMVCYIYFIRC